MTQFAIWVQFDLKPGARDAFLDAARRDATASVANESGCQRFDILVDPAVADRVCFYEIYADEAAFAVHAETPHLKDFRAATLDLIAGRAVSRLAVEQRAKS